MARKYRIVKIRDDRNYRTYTRVFLDYRSSIRIIDVESSDIGAWNGWKHRDYVVHKKVGDKFIAKGFIKDLAAFI